MMILLLLIAVIYFMGVSKVRGGYVKSVAEKKKKNSNRLNQKIIYTAVFSNKATRLFDFMFITSLILMGLLFAYTLAGNEAVAELLNINEDLCSFIAVIVWPVFLYVCAMTLLYGWVESIVVNEFLIITDEKVMGTSCKINGFKKEYSDFEIEFSQITDIIVQKTEKAAGIDMSTFSILTDTNKYDFVFLVDEIEIRNIISKRIQKSV